jgi:cytoskeletal protein CcmA (bactofilin family)
MENQRKSTVEVCVLAAGSAVEGNVKISSNLRLEGEIKGDLACNGKLVLSKTAAVTGNIICSELLSEGKIQGNVVAKTFISLAETAILNGDIQCSQLHIEKGAIFNGKCTMLKTEA